MSNLDKARRDLEEASNLLKHYVHPWDEHDIRGLQTLRDVAEAQQRALATLLQLVEAQQKTAGAQRGRLNSIEWALG